MNRQKTRWSASAAPTMPGRAMAERAHRVVEMRHRARAGVERRFRLLVARLGVAELTHHAGAGEAFDQGGGAAAGASVTTITPARAAISAVASASRMADEYCAGCAPLRARVDERPLDMDAERAGDVVLRLPRRLQRRVEHLGRVGDDGRHQRRRAEPAMRSRRCGRSSPALGRR